MNTRRATWRRNLSAIGMAAALAAIPSLGKAATYTWNGTSGGAWSTSANWSPNVTGGPAAADTAVIGDAASSQTVVYDGSATGTLNALGLIQATVGATNTLDVVRGGFSTGAPALTVTSNITLGGGNPAAVANLFIDPSVNYKTTAPATLMMNIGGSGTGTLTLNAGGMLTLGIYDYWTGSAWQQTGSQLNGNVTVSGGTITVPAVVTSTGTTITNSLAIGAGLGTLNGSLTMSSGTLSFGFGDANSGTRLQINGNFTATGGTVVGGTGTGSAFTLDGAVNSMSGTFAFTGSTPEIILFGNQNQTLTSTAAPGIVLVRANASGNFTDTVGVSATGTNIGQIQFGQQAGGYTMTLQLGSNLTSASSIVSQLGSSTAASIVGNAIDLNGYTLTQSGVNWTPTSTASSSTVDWFLTDTASGTGILSAASFNFSGLAGLSEIGYGAGSTASTLGAASVGSVVLKATGTSADNLGGTGSINPTSRFWYTGSSATVTSNRTVGQVEVGDGSASSTLKIVTASLTTAGTVKVNAGSTLDLGGQALGLSGAANLSGTGTLGSTSGGGSIAFASGATGGISPGGTANSGTDGAGSVGTLTLANAANISGLSLASTSTSTFDLASSGSYDILNLAGVAITYGGAITLDFLGGYTPVSGTTFGLFLNEGAGSSGSFSTINSNLTGDAFSFNSSTGVLTVSAVPEPPPAGLIGLAAAGMALLLLRRSHPCRHRVG